MLLVLSAATSCGDDGLAPDRRSPRTATLITAEDGWYLERGQFGSNEHLVAFRVIERGRSRIGILVQGDTRLLTPERTDASDFAWMPDGQQLLVAVDGRRGGAQLVIMSLEGEVLREVPRLAERLRFGTGMVVASDGKSAIISVRENGVSEKPADLVRVELASGKVEPLTDTPRLSEEYPALLHDDRKVVYAVGHLVADAPNPSSWISWLDLESRQVRQLTPPNHVVGSPAVFSDGRILYDAYEDGPGGRRGIWRLGEMSEGTTLVSSTAGRFPALNRSGDKLLLTRAGSPASAESLITLDLATDRS